MKKPPYKMRRLRMFANIWYIPALTPVSERQPRRKLFRIRGSRIAYKKKRQNDRWTSSFILPLSRPQKEVTGVLEWVLQNPDKALVRNQKTERGVPPYVFDEELIRAYCSGLDRLDSDLRSRVNLVIEVKDPDEEFLMWFKLKYL